MSKYEESTVLALGAHGSLRGRRFTLSGRAAVRSEGGGLWNEWNMTFEDGEVAALAEARGAFFVFDERALAAPWSAQVVGAPVDTGFVVVERGRAKRVATWGDAGEPSARAYAYADLSGRDGSAATIDYSDDDTRTFYGTRVTLKELGLAPRAPHPKLLPAPSGPRPKGLEPCLAIGDEGTIEGTRWRVIGLLHRSIRIDGERFTWEEYLAHDAAEGFRWLVVSDGHWNLVETIEAGEVIADDAKAVYRGEPHRFYSGGKARIEWADGELPWEAKIGDETRIRDYVKAPYVVSLEATDDEINWARGTWLPTETIARAFGKRVLPKPIGRAPNQPRKLSAARGGA